MKKTLLFFTLFILITSDISANRILDLESPDKKLKVRIDIKDKIYYSIYAESEVLLQENTLSLTLKDEVLGITPKLISHKYNQTDETITPLIPMKFSSVQNKYNAIILKFKGNYSVEFRAFDDGIAYRFITNKKGDLEVLNEDFTINFPNEYYLHLQQMWGDNFNSPYEEPYEHMSSKDFNSSSKKSLLPLLIDTKNRYKILISESDQLDYPVMLIKGTNNGMSGAFAKYPTDEKMNKGEENYIAKTIGNRNFPWRYFLITKDDKQIPENTMTLKLAPESKLANTSWIEAGQTVWDWWNYAMPYGVDFVAGRNQATYKYFIDFAAENNIPYSLIDDGWVKSGDNPFETNPNVNMKELMEYAKQKGVKIILWLHWRSAEAHLDTLFKTYREWGVAGVKVDFMERNDQWMVNFYERVAKEAAANKMIVLFHGSFKPAGMEYAYPNILSYEGVRGLEWKKECTADNSIYLPFMRNAVGAMDYTPGAMVSMQPEYYITSDYNPSAVGTRASQLAHFVLFESGIQMLADNPTRYNQEKECFDFIKQVPVVWDETRVLAAKVGEYIVTAKRKGNKWFIGAMVNSKDEKRVFDINLDFLTEGKEYQMTSFEDGPNAKYLAMDYKKKEEKVVKGKIINVMMTKNGGWAAILE